VESQPLLAYQNALYHIIELDQDDYSYYVIGYPNRNYCWIMGQKPSMSEGTYNSLTKNWLRSTSTVLNAFDKSPAKVDQRRTREMGFVKRRNPRQYAFQGVI
jgi:hypothetical protein